MRTQDYLKTASGNLQQAIQSCQAEIELARQAIMNRDQQVKNHLNELKREEATRLDEAKQTDSDQETASRMYNARMIRMKESQLENEFKKQKQELDQRIATMQRALNDFNQIQRQIDRYSAQIYPSTVLI